MKHGFSETEPDEPGRREEVLRQMNALVQALTHISLITRTAEIASGDPELDQIVEQLEPVLIAVAGVPCCQVYVMDTERGVLVPRGRRRASSESSPALFPDRCLDPAADSLVGRVLKDRKPTTFGAAETDLDSHWGMGPEFRARSGLAIPVGEQVPAVVLLGTLEEGHPFTSDEIDLASGIANLVALEADSARLYRLGRRHMRESEGIQRVLRSTIQTIRLEEVLEIVCVEAQQLTGATGSAVLLVEEGWLRVAHDTGQPMTTFDRIPVEGSLTGAAVRSGEPVLNNHPGEEVLRYFGEVKPTSFLAVPLRVDGTVLGALDVVNKPGGFTQDDLRIVRLFADQAAVNVEHARLHEQEERLAVLEERQRLARELHDSVIQSLYGMTLFVDAAALALAEGQTGVTAAHLQELRETAQEAMRDMRLLIFELHPPVLEKEGLVAALQSRLAAVETRANLKSEFRFEVERRLPLFMEQELYRIAQEALNNVLKHARAGRVTVHLQVTEAAACLEVQDDGAGFDPLATRNAGGAGLRSIEERVAKLSGRLTIESQQGAGTKVRVDIATPGEASAA